MLVGLGREGAFFRTKKCYGPMQHARVLLRISGSSQKLQSQSSSFWIESHDVNGDE
jgi:hypothetical protein